MRLANLFACVSTFVASQMKGWVIGKKLAIIYDPFDTSPAWPDRSGARARLRDELGLPPDTKVVVCVANLRPQKRATLFIEAAARIREKFAGDAVFVLIGHVYGDYLQDIEASVRRLDMSEHVRLLGFRTPIEPYLAGCDLLLAPSVEEGFGRTLVESMIVGTPVIAADSGGHAEIIRDGETGVLVPPDDITALADATLRILGDSDYAGGLAERAWSHAQQTYTIDRHVTEMMRKYDELLGRPSFDAMQDASIVRKPS